MLNAPPFPCTLVNLGGRPAVYCLEAQTRERPHFLARFQSYRFLGLLLAVMALLIGSPFCAEK